MKEGPTGELSGPRIKPTASNQTRRWVGCRMLYGTCYGILFARKFSFLITFYEFPCESIFTELQQLEGDCGR